MIVGSLLLLLGGVAMLIVGLVRGEDTYLVGTIVASLIAAVCLYGASRRNKTSRDTSATRTPERPSRREEAEVDTRLRSRVDDAPTAVVPRAREEEPADLADLDDKRATESGNKRATESGKRNTDLEVESDAAPSDEPAEIPMSSVEAAALMRMDAEVMVVDGRPRFHLGGCVHLVGRESEPLPAYEAVELGFGACALCRPAQSLLREPTRR